MKIDYPLIFRKSDRIALHGLNNEVHKLRKQVRFNGHYQLAWAVMLFVLVIIVLRRL